MREDREEEETRCWLRLTGLTDNPTKVTRIDRDVSRKD